jgi:hypothetical protein
MGVRKYTYEELMVAHRKQGVKLMHVREERKLWKERTRVAEAKAKQLQQIFDEYTFIDKKPDYYFSFSGLLIFRRFYILNGLRPIEVELLVIISYVHVFLKEDLKLYNRNYLRVRPLEILEGLVQQGYVLKTTVPGKSKSRMRMAWVLTQRGKDIEADYERFYDKKMEELKAGKLTRFNFEDGAYFRKVYLTRHQRRILQGGGMLPNATRDHTATFVDQEVYQKLIQNELNEKARFKQDRAGSGGVH